MSRFNLHRPVPKSTRPAPRPCTRDFRSPAQMSPEEWKAHFRARWDAAARPIGGFDDYGKGGK